MLTAKDFRNRAWSALNGRWGTSILTALVASILGGSVTMSGSSPGQFFSFSNGNGEGDDVQNQMSQAIDSMPDTVVTGLIVALLGMGVIIFALSIARFIVGGFISLGLIRYNLDLLEGGHPEFDVLFSRTNMLKKGLLLEIRVLIFTFLWTLLFIIPGIIKAYSYSMAGFIMEEHPEIEPKEAVALSMDLMSGNKWRKFCLDISFIGWILLTVITCGIAALFLAPYYNAATAAFYKEICSEKGML